MPKHAELLGPWVFARCQNIQLEPEIYLGGSGRVATSIRCQQSSIRWVRPARVSAEQQQRQPVLAVDKRMTTYMPVRHAPYLSGN